MKAHPWLRWTASATAAALFLAGVTLAGPSLGQTSAALFLVLGVVISAVALGRAAALGLALAAALGFNYFFLAPLHTFQIAHSQDVVSFAVFIATAVIVGQLSSRAEKRTLQAEMRKQQLQVAQQSERLKTALLDAVTHDLRTPLTSVMAAVTTLRSTRLSDEGRAELLEVIEQDTTRLDRFIQKMIDLAKLEAGALPLVTSEVSAVEIMEDAISRARSALSGRNVEMHVAPNVPGLRVDPRLISQVLFTLLENAAKYAPPGAPVELGVAPGNANCVRFSVTDSGPGVVPEMRSHVFEKFVSLNGRGGLGLGLAIARGIVESHGGRIWIDSASESNGARVSFEIPAGVAR